MSVYALKIMPREVILDTQGRAVEQALVKKDYPIKKCKVGKYLEIEVEDSLKQDTAIDELSLVKKMAEELLYNPLLETVKIEKIGES